MQCDNGREFPLEFALAVEAAGIRHRYIRPRRPQQNGKVERSHRIDHEEFWGRHRFADFETATTALRQWETRYNHERLSLALKGRTPAEKLAAVPPPHCRLIPPNMEHCLQSALTGVNLDETQHRGEGDVDGPGGLI